MAGFGFRRFAGPFVGMRRRYRSRHTPQVITRHTCVTLPAVAGKSKRQRERDLMVEIREVEALSVECHKCDTRIEVTWEGTLAEGAVCPSCGESLDGWRAAVALFHDLMRETMGATDVRLRVRLLTRLPL